MYYFLTQKLSNNWHLQERITTRGREREAPMHL